MDELVLGSYIHGLFDNDELRAKILDSISGDKESQPVNYNDLKEEGYRKLAELVRKHIDMDRLYEIIEKTDNKLRVVTI
jgi:adenosylcobyric acid synthase